MCKKFADHFKKYNQMYSFGLLLIVTLLVAFLFLRIDALETDIDRQVNEPNVDHQLTVEQLKKKARTETIKTEVTVSPEALPDQGAPGVVVPGSFVPGELPPGSPPMNGTVVPTPTPTPDNTLPPDRMLPPNGHRP